MTQSELLCRIRTAEQTEEDNVTLQSREMDPDI